MLGHPSPLFGVLDLVLSWFNTHKTIRPDKEETQIELLAQLVPKFSTALDVGVVIGER